MELKTDFDEKAKIFSFPFISPLLPPLSTVPSCLMWLQEVQSVIEKNMQGKFGEDNTAKRKNVLCLIWKGGSRGELVIEDSGGGWPTLQVHKRGEREYLVSVGKAGGNIIYGLLPITTRF